VLKTIAAFFKSFYSRTVRFGAPPAGRRSSQWPAKRKEHLKAEPTCQACGTTEHLQVHHILPFHLFPNLELDPKNLITLCEMPSRNCHYNYGHGFDWHLFDPEVRTVAGLQLRRFQRIRTDHQTYCGY
jgi:5-methylcytosine-specific restriction protein A